ncbi:helix-turn-helix transcriptional regulator [Streptomyces viridosporus]|uniref:helix-turn-helix domain-containing protein n=1 Tax=Streptomyces viridosporus TaxID=67581 RepID=UPI003322192B
MQQTARIREASRRGDYGRVIELVRRDRRMTQLQLGQALGMSQSAVSRLEKRGTGTYRTDALAAAAAHLDIAPELVGLSGGRPRSRARDDDDMHRRVLLGGAVAALRLSTAGYRRRGRCRTGRPAGPRWPAGGRGSGR